jgi:hypothetical protein
LTSNDAFADGFYVALEYDPEYLGYAWYLGSGDKWHVVEVTPYSGRRVTFRVERGLAQKSDAGATDEETPALRAVFFLRKDNPDEEPFWVRTTVSLGPDGVSNDNPESYFYMKGPGNSPRRIATRVISGDLAIYFREGVEVGWGAITRTAQEFILPLYLTYLGEDRRLFMVGVDYDEIFLGLMGVNSANDSVDSSLLEESLVVDSGQVRFQVRISEEFEDPICRLHVADLRFRYSGETPPNDELLVKPVLVAEAAPEPPPEGDGASGDGIGAVYGENVAGIVTILPAYFLRGNADSSTETGPDGQVTSTRDLTDVMVVLNAIFFGGPPVPCADAGDANDDGSLQITDAVLLLQYFFGSGRMPAAPNLVAGLDPTASDVLDCKKPLPFFQSVRGPIQATR